MVDLLSINMHKKLIYNVILPKIDCDSTAFRMYKVMIRAQNASAYVNAGFNICHTQGTVTKARICYGGIRPAFTHATRTEDVLVGCDLYSDATIQMAVVALSLELQPDWVLPDASPEYRQKLAIALFYRFVLRTCPPHKVSAVNRSGANAIKRPLSSGSLKFTTEPEKYPLTKPIDKYEGLEQTSGEAMYINDMPPMRGELFAAIAVARRVNMTIATIDAGPALVLPGVVSFHTLEDIRGKNDFTYPSPFTTVPEPIFVGKCQEVLYNGQPFGVLCATSSALAQRAVKLIKITYMQSPDKSTTHSVVSFARLMLSPIFGTPTGPDRPRYHSSQPPKVATQLGANPVVSVVRGRFETGGQYHHMMETYTCICVPAEKVLNVYTSTQWIEMAQMAIAGMLDIPESKVRVCVKRIGGSFGAKMTRSGLFSCIAALPSYLLNRPVRLVVPMEQCMQSVGKRYGIVADYAVDVDARGAIQRLELKYTQDAGSSINEDVTPLLRSAMHNCYRTESWSIDGGYVVTDAPSNTLCRSPGSFEAIATAENVMDHIRWATGLDGVDVRLANIAPGHPMRQLLADFMRETAYRERQAEIVKLNASQRWRKRGISLVPMQWNAIFAGWFPAYVCIYHRDGSVVVQHGGIEMGQGTNTRVGQVVAFALGIPLDQVSITATDNVTSGNTFVDGGSTTTSSVCFSAKRCCEILLERMKPVRDKMPAGYTWPQLAAACYKEQIDLGVRYQFQVTEGEPYAVYGVTSCEVEVDVLTGVYQISNVQLWEDVGESINPKLDAGQVEGGFAMGLGYWTCEKLVYNRADGELLTRNTWTYKTPGAGDIPVNMDVKLIANGKNPNVGMLRSKAVGEPATTMAVVVMFALREAINAFRDEQGCSHLWFPMSSATTPEDVQLYCQVDPIAFTL